MTFEQFKAKLLAESKTIEKDVLAGTRAVAAEMLADAQERVPVVTGELRDSARLVEIPDGARLEFTAEHASRVHENPESEGYRFLESVVDERSGRIADDIAQRTKAVRNG